MRDFSQEESQCDLERGSQNKIPPGTRISSTANEEIERVSHSSRNPETRKGRKERILFPKTC